MKRFCLLLAVVLLACSSSVSVGQEESLDPSQELLEIESIIAKIAEQFRGESTTSASDSEILKRLNEDLKTRVTRAFQLQQKIQERKISKARDDLFAVEERLKQRSANADKIIAHRIEELTKTSDSKADPEIRPFPNQDVSSSARTRIIRMFVDLSAPMTVHRDSGLLHITTANTKDAWIVESAIVGFNDSRDGDLVVKQRGGIDPELFVRGSDDALKNLMDAFEEVGSSIRSDASKETVNLMVNAKDELLRQIKGMEEQYSEFRRNTPVDEASIKRAQDRIVEYESRISKNQLELVSLDVKLPKIKELLKGGKPDVAKSLLTPSLQSQFNLSGATDTQVALAIESMVGQQETLKSETNAYEELVAQAQAKLRELQVFGAQEKSLRTELARTHRIFDAVVARIEEINIVREQQQKRIIWVD